jgi:hypothetical protein
MPQEGAKPHKIVIKHNLRGYRMIVLMTYLSLFTMCYLIGIDSCLNMS